MSPEVSRPKVAGVHYAFEWAKDLEICAAVADCRRRTIDEERDGINFPNCMGAGERFPFVAFLKPSVIAIDQVQELSLGSMASSLRVSTDVFHHVPPPEQVICLTARSFKTGRSAR